jgi:hypothetical protein
MSLPHPRQSRRRTSYIMSPRAAPYERYLRRLSPDELEREQLQRLNGRDMSAVEAILRELDDRQHGRLRGPERWTSTGRRLHLVHRSS